MAVRVFPGGCGQVVAFGAVAVAEPVKVSAVWLRRWRRPVR